MGERERVVIPRPTLYSLDAYLRYGSPPGAFLAAVLENNLKEAILHADSASTAALPVLVRFLLAHVPALAWGGTDEMALWRKLTGGERETLLEEAGYPEAYRAALSA